MSSTDSFVAKGLHQWIKPKRSSMQSDIHARTHDDKDGGFEEPTPPLPAIGFSIT